jgi:hypothetical protein
MRIVAVVGIALGVWAVPGEAQRIFYEGGLSASTGTYIFTERTNSFALSTGLHLSAGRFSFRAAVPVWMQNTSLITSSGAGPVPTGGPYGREAVRDSGQARDQRHQGALGPGGPGNGRMILAGLVAAQVPAPSPAVTGYQIALADPALSGSVRVVDGGRVSVGFGATLKFPLADTATVGTGEWDFGGHLSVSILAGRRWTFALDASYWHLGDLDSLQLVDPVLASVSAGALLGDHWGAMLSLTGSTRTLTGFDPPLTITGAMSRVGLGVTWGFSLGAGLTESAPDLSIGLLWTVPLLHGGSR